MLNNDLMIYGLPPCLLQRIPHIRYFLWSSSPQRKLLSAVGNVCLSGASGDHHVPQPGGGLVQPLCKDSLAWITFRKGRINLNRLDDQGGKNRGVFSSTAPSVGNCSIFSNTQSKSIFLKVLVTPSSFSLGNEAAANHSSFKPLRLWGTGYSSYFPC